MSGFAEKVFPVSTLFCSIRILHNLKKQGKYIIARIFDFTLFSQQQLALFIPPADTIEIEILIYFVK